MALTNTLLQDAVIMVEDGKFGDFEKRYSQTGALEAAKQNADGMLSTQQVTNMKKAVNRVEKVAVLNRYTPSIITDPSCSITGGRPTSAYASISWAFKGFEIIVIPEENEANYISEAEDVADQMAAGWRTIFESLDTNVVTALESNKSTDLVTSNQKDITTNSGDYTFTGEPTDLLLSVPALMELNSLRGPMENVASIESMAVMAKIEALGANNYRDVKGAIQRTGQYRHFLTSRVTVPEDAREAHYFMPQNTLGIYNWVDHSSRSKYQAGNKKWDTMKDPMFGFDWSVFSVEDCMDNTSLSGNRRVYGYKAQIGAWFAILTAYRSGNASPIVKVIRIDQA